MKFKTYQMGAAVAERMAVSGLTAFLDHAVAFPYDSQEKTLCGVKTRSLCMDDSLSTDEMPDCPACIKIIQKFNHEN